MKSHQLTDFLKRQLLMVVKAAKNGHGPLHGLDQVRSFLPHRIPPFFLISAHYTRLPPSASRKRRKIPAMAGYSPFPAPAADKNSPAEDRLGPLPGRCQAFSRVMVRLNAQVSSAWSTGHAPFALANGMLS